MTTKKSWIDDGHIKYWWELTKAQKVFSIFVFTILWLVVWGLLEYLRLGTPWFWTVL